MQGQRRATLCLCDQAQKQLIEQAVSDPYRPDRLEEIARSGVPAFRELRSAALGKVTTCDDQRCPGPDTTWS
jgi:hypothetical protein